MNVVNFSVYSAEDNPHLLQADPKAVKSQPHKSHRKRNWLIALFAILLIFFTPWRINILLLGIDPTHNETFQGRSDTMILASIPPVLPYAHMLSIPRDLWVEIPGHWQNRINTAHFFAEIEKEGSGPDAAATVVAQSFGVAKPYVVRIKTDGFKSVVDAMGGVTVYLPTDMSGMTAGEHELDATQALRFVRDRTGSDDFFRQGRAQIFLKGAMKKMLNPINWWRIPGMMKAISSSITSNVPLIYYPRVAYTMLFSYVKGFDMQTLDRNTMVTPWVTNEGAQVLVPVWENIAPLIQKYFK
ncbi:MAG: LCP family protein [Anaerolineaceae bacterium]|nr:LCP family protein [Anaerolineaceae bacterium]